MPLASYFWKYERMCGTPAQSKLFLRLHTLFRCGTISFPPCWGEFPHFKGLLLGCKSNNLLMVISSDWQVHSNCGQNKTDCCFILTGRQSYWNFDPILTFFFFVDSKSVRECCALKTPTLCWFRCLFPPTFCLWFPTATTSFKDWIHLPGLFRLLEFPALQPVCAVTHDERTHSLAFLSTSVTNGKFKAASSWFLYLWLFELTAEKAFFGCDKLWSLTTFIRLIVFLFLALICDLLNSDIYYNLWHTTNLITSRYFPWNQQMSMGFPRPPEINLHFSAAAEFPHAENNWHAQPEDVLIFWTCHRLFCFLTLLSEILGLYVPPTWHHNLNIDAADWRVHWMTADILFGVDNSYALCKLSIFVFVFLGGGRVVTQFLMTVWMEQIERLWSGSHSWVAQNHADFNDWERGQWVKNKQAQIHCKSFKKNKQTKMCFPHICLGGGKVSLYHRVKIWIKNPAFLSI